MLASPAWTGSARLFAAAARGLAERGHTVLVACPPESPVEQRLEFGSYEVLPLPADLPAPAVSLKLRGVLRDRAVEAVLVHQDHEHLIAALAARWARRVAVLRRVPVATAMRVGGTGRLALRLAPTGFIFASDDEIRRAASLARARLQPAVVTPGVDVAWYDNVRPVTRNAIGAPSQARLLICVCDAGSRVRSASVLRTVALLSPRHPELHLIMVGEGAADEDLKMHAAALRITKSVSFLGKRDDQIAVLRLAELAWVVSSGDDAAFALLDLMAMRVPVLAERGGMAQSYVADGIAGLILPAGDAAESAAAIARLLAHEEQRTTMGSAGRSRVAREFSEPAMLDAFERAVAGAAEAVRR
jgi:glycosyltransferase involved in cell wall biosynthesis